MKILTVTFWVQLFISTFMTMLMIYLIKTVAGKYNIPVVSAVAKEV